MASTGDQPMFDEHEYEDEDEDFDEEEFADADEAFGDNLNPNPTMAFASPFTADNAAIQPASASANDRKLTPFDDSRRLFQRLWTEEDEITILEGFLEFVTRRGTTHNNYQHDTGPFYEQIKGKIPLEFNKNQLIEKIRRLKKKYRTVDGRMKAMGEAFAFKSPHERVTYEISKQIWSSTFKRPRGRRYKYNQEKSNLGEGNGNVVADEIGALQQQLPAAAEGGEDPNVQFHPTSTPPPPPPVSVSSIVEETVKCCLAPLFKELLHHGIGGGGMNGSLMLNSLPLSLSLSNGLGDLPKGLDGEKWREQQILELEVYLKRVELLEEQIKATLHELRSSSSSSAMRTDS